MIPTYLPIAIKNTGMSLEDILAVVPRTGPNQKVFGRISELNRRLAIGQLLMTGDPQPFAAHLFQGARAYAYFVASVADAEKPTSRAALPFFDAVTCQDDQGAREIATRSPAAHDPKREYEEDFFYARFMMDLYLHGAAHPGLPDLVTKWEGFDVQGADLRIPLCKALLFGDQDEFLEALQDAVDKRVEKLQSQEEADRLGPDEAAFAPFASTEVLAWVELGRRRGLEAPADLPLAPASARLLKPLSFPDPESWRTTETYRSLRHPNL